MENTPQSIRQRIAAQQASRPTVDHNGRPTRVVRDDAPVAPTYSYDHRGMFVGVEWVKQDESA